MYALILCFCAMVLQQAAPAAIPMWEYLSKDEKMSYLYSMFANQVDEFCEFSDMNNCNQELLRFGLGKLKDMPEDHLDTMDPYQRGAHGIIWDSMMEGHEMTKKPQTIRPYIYTTTPKPNSYDDYAFRDYQGQASAKIETIYRVPAPPNYSISKGPSQYRPAPIATKPIYYYNNMEVEHPPLTGPMVVRVHLDGRPVNEAAHVPHDEDLRQYKMSKVQLPRF